MIISFLRQCDSFAEASVNMITTSANSAIFVEESVSLLSLSIVTSWFHISFDKMYVPKKENAENICVLGNRDHKKNYGLKLTSYCDREKEDIFGVFKKSLSDSHLLSLSILKEVINFNTLYRSYIFLHVSVLYLFNSLPWTNRKSLIAIRFPSLFQFYCTPLVG